MTVARQSAECTGLRAAIIPSAPKIITGASIQNATAAPVTSGISKGVTRSPRLLRRMPAPVPEARVDGARRSRFDGRARTPPLADIAGAIVRLSCRRQPKEVGLLVVTQPALVGRLLHTGQQRRKQIRFLIDQLLASVVGELELVRHGQGSRRARLGAYAAEDAP